MEYPKPADPPDQQGGGGSNAPADPPDQQGGGGDNDEQDNEE